MILIFSKDFIMVKNSNTSVSINVMRAFYIQNVKSDENLTKTKKKIKCHISKFMLELYENNKIGINNSNADVVRSVVPKHAGKFCKNLISYWNKLEISNDAKYSEKMIEFEIEKKNNYEMIYHC